MDKQTVLIVAVLALAGGLAFFAMRGGTPAPGGSGSGSADAPPARNEPLPEDRVISATERIYQLGRRVYDDVRERQGPAK